MGVDATRERSLLHALHAAVPRGGGAFHVLRVVTAPELEARLSNEGADAVLLGEGLFELSPRTFAILADPSRPVVLLGAAPGGVCLGASCRFRLRPGRPRFAGCSRQPCKGRRTS
jgi:hypothetical protein